MIGICKDEEDVLQDRNEELLEEQTRRSLIGYFSHVVHEFKAHAQAGILDFAIVVLAGPHAGINHKLELTAIELQKGREAIQIDGLEQLEEFNTVFRVFGKVFVDHFERAFEDILHNCRNFVFHETLSAVSIEHSYLAEHSDRESRGMDCPTYMELGDDGGHYIQDLGITCVRDITVVVTQHCLHERWYEVGVDGFQIIGLQNVYIDEFQDFLLDRPHSSDFGHLCGDQS